MNARQKAKHYKRLYEQNLIRHKMIRFPYPSEKLTHYTARKMVFSDETDDFPPELLHKCICRELMEYFSEAVMNNIEVEDEGRRKIYHVDIWLRK